MSKLIRIANNNDVKEINLLGAQLHHNFENLFHIETEIDSSLAVVLVSEDCNGINGYLYALDFGDNLDLLSIFVDNRYRSNHIGTNMLKELVNICPNKTITLEVDEKNIAALQLYYSFGFKVVGNRKNYYENGDAYIMKWGI